MQGTPLKFEFSLSEAIKDGLIPAMNTSEFDEVLTAMGEDPNPGISPVASAVASPTAISAVAYDGYLDSCQVRRLAKNSAACLLSGCRITG